MSYYPNNQYQQRIEHYQSLLDTIDDIDGLEVPSSEDNEKEVKAVEKGIANTVSALKNTTEDLLNIVRQEVYSAYDLAMDNYVEYINNPKNETDDFEVFPFNDWIKVAKFKEKKDWLINRLWLDPVKYVKVDSDQKREIVLLNVWQYWQDYKLMNAEKSTQGLKEVKIFLDLFKDEKISGFYEHILYGNPLSYITELKENKTVVALDKWNDEAFLNLSSQWKDTEKRNEILEVYANHFNANPERHEYLNRAFMDVFFNKSFNGDKEYVEIVDNSIGIIVKNISYEKILDFVHLDIKHKFGYQETLIDKLTYLDKLWKYAPNRTEQYQEFVSVANPIYLAAKLEDKLETNLKPEKKVKI